MGLRIKSRRLRMATVSLILFGVFTTFLNATLNAQQTEGIIIDYVDESELSDRLDLEVFFRVDAKRFGDAEPEEVASLMLQSQPDNGYTSSVRRSNNPYFVVLIVGNGASTAQNLWQLQDKLAEVIDTAPGEPHFAIVEYSDFVNRSQPVFTPVRSEIISSLNQIETSDRESVCLLNAVADSISLLDGALSDQPEIPKSILIVAAEDEQTQNFEVGGCNMDRQSVIQSADRSNVMINSINFSPRGGLDSDPLKILSDFTRGNWILGEDNSFNSNSQSEFFLEESNQWVARTAVFPLDGEQFATLNFVVDEIPLVTTFSFFSSRIYNQPLGDPTLSILSFPYDSDTDTYTLELDLTNLKVDEGNIRIRVWNNSTNNSIYDEVFLGLDSTRGYSIPTDILENEGSYKLEIIALDSGNIPLQNSEGEIIQIEQEFVYLPIVIPPPFVEIGSVKENLDEGALYIFFETENADPESTLEGFFRDANQRQEGDFGPVKIGSSEFISVPLPVLEFDTEEPLEFTLAMSIQNPDLQTTQAEDYQFGYIPQQPPGFFERNLWLIMGLTVIAGAVAAYLLYQRSNKQGEYNLPGLMGDAPKRRKAQQKTNSNATRRQNINPNQPKIRQGLASSHSKESVEDREQKRRTTDRRRIDRKEKNKNIFIKVVQSNNNDLIDKKYLISELPFTLGRKHFKDDQLISGSHLEIGEDEQGLYVRDLGSKNKTFVGEAKIELVPNVPYHNIKSTPPTPIRLGKRTTIILQFDEDAF